MDKINYFQDLIGQEKLQNRLNFLVDGYKNSGVTQNVLFIAQRGAGKSFAANLFARALNHIDVEKGEKKPLIEVNASQIKNSRQFIEAILIPYQNQSFTCLLDESHSMSDELQTFLLSALAPNKENKNTIQHDGGTVDVNFRKHTFLMTTTEPQKMLLPLIDRTTIINIGEYSKEALACIIQKHCEHKIENSVALEVASYCRGNARSAVLMAKEVNTYRFAVGSFNQDDVKPLMIILDIFPLGISRIELTTLEKLLGSDSQSLQTLCAKTGLTKSGQMDIEKRLLSLGLMEIDVKRKITAKGRQYLIELKNW